MNTNDFSAQRLLSLFENCRQIRNCAIISVCVRLNEELAMYSIEFNREDLRSVVCVCSLYVCSHIGLDQSYVAESTSM